MILSATVFLLLAFSRLLSKRCPTCYYLSRLLHALLLQHPARQHFEYLLYVVILLGACLQETDLISLGQCLCLLPGDLSLMFKVCLCPNQYHISLSIAVIPDLIDPAFDMAETDWVIDSVS